jgi:hypothetical protein
MVLIWYCTRDGRKTKEQSLASVQHQWALSAAAAASAKAAYNTNGLVSSSFREGVQCREVEVGGNAVLRWMDPAFREGEERMESNVAGKKAPFFQTPIIEAREKAPGPVLREPE